MKRFQLRRDADYESWGEFSSKDEAERELQKAALNEYRGYWPAYGNTESPEDRGEDFDKIKSNYYIEELE